MAIYYIDPYTTTNGNGSWASPYSFSSSTRATLAPGDEIRIIGKSLAYMSTPDEYIAYHNTSSGYGFIDVTSGGNLGADFLAGDYIYFTGFDTFARVLSVSGNTIRVGNNMHVPVPTTSTSTPLYFYKINLSVATPSTTGSEYFLWTNSTTNLTVSDCWISETERVTDGSVKSLVRTSANNTTFMYAYLDSNALNVDTRDATGSVYNLQNTHFTASQGSMMISTYSNNAVINVNQVFATSSSGNPIYIGDTTRNGLSGGSFTVKSYSAGFSSPFSGTYAENYTVTINNVYMNASLSTIHLYETNGGRFSGTLNIGNLLCTGMGNYLFTAYNIYRGTLTINFTGVIDCRANVAVGPFAMFTNTINNSTNMIGTNVIVNFGSGVTIYHNLRTSTFSGITGYASQSHNAVIPSTYSNIIEVNSSTSAVISRATIGSSYFIPNSYYAITQSSHYNPLVYNISFKSLSYLNGRYFMYQRPINIAYTFKNGDAPFEILSIVNLRLLALDPALGECPIASMDNSVYNIAAPSLKINLATRTANYWLYGGIASNPKSYSLKSIKVPVLANKTYTITGYIRTDMTTYATGDCSVMLNNANSTLTSQSINTECINAWKQFTLTVNTTKTEELNFVIKTYFAEGAKSIWLSDLSITSN